MYICIRWNPDSKYSDVLVSAGDDGLINLWKLEL